MGDATNMVIILGGELLKKSEHLLIMGLHPSEIIRGYELACTKALSELESAFIAVCPHLTSHSTQNYRQQAFHFL
jgi:T-complex protein 1 subunit theta